MIVVSNATPLISLSLVGQLDLLRNFYSEIRIPRAVYAEVVEQGGYRVGATEVARADWIHTEIVSEADLKHVLPRPSQLHLGEIETIALALQLSADVVLIDEQLARKVAVQFGLKVIGTLGILKDAHQQGKLADLKSALDNLRANGIRISDALYREVLR